MPKWALFRRGLISGLHFAEWDGDDRPVLYDVEADAIRADEEYQKERSILFQQSPDPLEVIAVIHSGDTYVIGDGAAISIKQARFTAGRL